MLMIRPAPLTHHRLCVAARVNRKHRSQVGRDHLVPVLVAHPRDQRVAGDPRVVDDDVESPHASTRASIVLSTAAESVTSQA